MFEYMVEFDGINDCEIAYYVVHNWWELIGFVKNALNEMGGGHADIYDEDGDFVDNIEV